MARSRPGDLPYQRPTTPSKRASGRLGASWLPSTAVAASSSLTPGLEHDAVLVEQPAERAELEVVAAERGSLVAGDEGGRVQPAGRSARRRSSGSRASACTPVICASPVSAV